MLSGLLLVGGQTIDFPQIWQKIEGKWSYVGQVKEKTQILVWIEKQTKTRRGWQKSLSKVCQRKVKFKQISAQYGQGHGIF